MSLIVTAKVYKFDTVLISLYFWVWPRQISSLEGKMLRRNDFLETATNRKIAQSNPLLKHVTVRQETTQRPRKREVFLSSTSFARTEIKIDARRIFRRGFTQNAFVITKFKKR